MVWRIGQFVLIIIPLTALVWLFRIEIVPDGVFRVDHTVGTPSPYIDALAPQTRVEGSRIIIDDPVFFFLHPHRQFDRAAFEIWFKNNGVPIAEFGGLVQTKPDVYDLQPLNNMLIDRLAWEQVRDGELSLYQKSSRYDSIEQFFSDPPERKRVAVYKADYRAPFRLSSYAPSAKPIIIEASLRGKHEFKTYIKNETLNVRFEYMDMNRDNGADPVVITVFNEQGQPVVDARAEDDGDTRGNAIPSAMREVRLFVPGLSEGVYKVVMSAPRDIFFRKIHTTQSKLVFLGAAYLGDEVSYRETSRAVEAWSATQRLRVETRHASGVQELTIGDNVFFVGEPYRPYTFEGDGRLLSIVIPKGDIEMVFDGSLAFAEDQYFEPDPVVLRPYTDVEAKGIEFVLTSYRPPEEKDGWLVKRLEFDVAPLVFEKGAWKFTFSTPEIRERGAQLEVGKINLTWTRAPFAWRDVLK